MQEKQEQQQKKEAGMNRTVMYKWQLENKDEDRSLDVKNKNVRMKRIVKEQQKEVRKEEVPTCG